MLHVLRSATLYCVALERIDSILPRVLADVLCRNATAKPGRQRREGHIEPDTDPPRDLFLDAGVPLLPIHHARHDGLIDAEVARDCTHPAVAQQILPLMARQYYRCVVGHVLTWLGLLRQSNYDVHRGTSSLDRHFFAHTAKMPRDKRLAARMFEARHRREGQLGHKLVLREIAESVSVGLGRREPYDPSVIARWLNGQQEPKTRRQWVALADALAVDVGWLAFGEASGAPMVRATPAIAFDDDEERRLPPDVAQDDARRGKEMLEGQGTKRRVGHRKRR